MIYSRDWTFWKAWACSRVPGLIYWPGSNTRPVVQENPRRRKNPERSKNVWAGTLGTGKTQALIQI